MAATAWAFYNKFKEYQGDNTIDLDGGTFLLALVQTASNFETATLTAFADVTSEVAAGNGYTAGGKTVTGVTWATGASASEMRFDSTTTQWSASGGSIANIAGAVLYQSTGELVCFSRLTTAQFTLTDTNFLKVTPSANGYYELN